MTMNKKVLGKNIRDLPCKVAPNVAAFAWSLGYTKQVVYHWMNGDNAPSLESMIRISVVYGVSIDKLVEGVADM